MLICQQTHKSHRNYHLITVRLLLIHITIGCVHKTRPRKETRHSATCFVHTYRSPYLLWCQAAWAPCHVLSSQQNVNSYQPHCG